MSMSNHWNHFIYRLWSPVYDALFTRLFLPGRLLALRLLALQPGENVLLVGVGTGADLPLLPANVEAIGVDFSPDMLAKATRRLPACRAPTQLIRGDAQALFVAEGSFDTAIANLILSVVPDGNACLKATLQALKPGGRIVIFDKFQPDNHKPSLMRKIMNYFSSLLGTDITRSYGDLSRDCGCVIEQDVPSLFNGMYRVILVRKAPGDPDEQPNGSHQLRGG